MNHRADSWKNNLAINVAKLLIAEHWRLLSYTIVEALWSKCGDADRAVDELRKIPQKPGWLRFVLREPTRRENRAQNGATAKRIRFDRVAAPVKASRDQFRSVLACFFDLCGLARVDLRGFTGLTPAAGLGGDVN